ncbi:MAG: N-glycosylase/DNA lyase [Ignavibacteriales bacterium]|nr:N-glycosylase/DNA lyase [Ignavibacteriales bacterium]
MKKVIQKLSLDELRTFHRERKNAIRHRLREFSRIPQTEYFYELVYCLLTPQSSAVNAEKAVKLLKETDFFHEPVDPEPLLHQKEFYIRFHKTKAKHLLHTREQFPLIADHLSNGSSSAELREWLVQNVRGLGWKEASHFLRNVGHRNLAILDRHILKNLVRVGVLRHLPKTLTAKRYKIIEKKFHTFARQIGIPMDELDLLFWSMETGEILK